MTRKGFTLIEMLGVLGVMVTFSLALTELLNALFAEVPRTQRMVAENSAMIDMLEYLQRDIDAAISLPEKRWPYQSDPNTILIERNDGMVVYQVKQDSVVRKILFTLEGHNEPREISRPLTHARLEFRLIRNGQEAYATEVDTWIEQAVGGHSRRRLENSHIFYLGSYPAQARDYEKALK